MANFIEQVEQDIASALKVDSGAHGSVNLRCMIALDYSDFVSMCAADVQAGEDYCLPVVDASGSGVECPGGRTLGAMPYRKDAFGAGLDEYVMDKIRTYAPTCDAQDLRRMGEGMRAYSKLAGRVAAHADLLDTVDRASLALLRKMRNLDAPMWDVFCDQGKQHVDGITSALLDVDGNHNERDADTTRADETATPWVRNGKSFHIYAQTTGSFSERDAIAE